MGITFGIGGGTLYFGDLNDPDSNPVEVKAINLLRATTDEKEEDLNGEEENTQIK